MSVNIKVVLLTAGRNTKPPADRQWLRVTVRPGYVPEMGIGRGRGGRLDLYRRGQVLLVIVLGPLRLPLRHGAGRVDVSVVQPLPVYLRGVLLLQMLQLLQLLYRLEYQARHGGLHLVAPRYRRMGDVVGAR